MNNFFSIVMQSSILILALLGIRKIFLGRISPILQHALWGIAALRLFLPIRIESVLSIFNFAKISAAEQTVSATVPAFPQTNAAVLPQITSPSPQINAPQTVTPPASAAVPAAESISFAEWFRAALPWIWIIGMAVVLVCILIVNFRFYRHIAKHGRPQDGYIICDRISSPCLIGLFRPRIVLNKKAAADETAKKYALLHERMHLHHGDHIWALLRTLACVVYWFNPLVWIAAHFSRLDQELACDHAVICRIGEENRIEYGEALVSLIRRSRTLPTPTTAMTGGKNSMRQRIRLIANRPRMLKITAFILVAVTLVVCIVSCTGSVSDKMPFEVSAENTYDPKLHYDRDPLGLDPLFKEHSLEEEDAVQIVSLLNNSTEISRLKKDEFRAHPDKYLTLSLTGGGIIAIYPAGDGEHIFFNRNGTKNYKAKNPDLVEYIEQQAQELTESVSEDPQPSAVPEKTYDRTDAAQVAEEFLTKYFDDLCEGRIFRKWTKGDTLYDGLVIYSDDYYENIGTLSQWGRYVRMLNMTQKDYDREQKMGRFISLEVESFGILDSMSIAEFSVKGYFRTTAFGTKFDLNLAQNEKGEYQIVGVYFPYWRSYCLFNDHFYQYMGENNFEDYMGEGYIDYLRYKKPDFDSADPISIGQNFFSRYFSDLCSGNAAIIENYSDILDLDSDLNLFELNTWITYNDALAHQPQSFHYPDELFGQYMSLENVVIMTEGFEAGSAEQLVIGNVITEALTIPVEYGVKQDADGTCKITTISLHWSDYNIMTSALYDYLNERSLYNYDDRDASKLNEAVMQEFIESKIPTVDSLWETWQNAERLSAPYEDYRSVIELSQIDARLNSNATYLSKTEKTDEGIIKDTFCTKRDDYPASNWELLNVFYIPVDPDLEDHEVFHYAEQFVKSKSSVISQQSEYIVPEIFFGKETPIVNMYAESYITEYYLSMWSFPLHDAITRYWMHYQKDGEEYVLVFQIRNALDYGEGFGEGADYVGWYLLQSLEDCWQWMKTLKFS